MSVTPTPIFPQTIKTPAVQINNSSGTGSSTLVTGGTNGTKVENILVSSNDTSDRILLITITSPTSIIVGQVNIPAGSGITSGVPAVNILASSQFTFNVDAFGNPYMYLANGVPLVVATTTTVTSGKQLGILAQAGDY
jgi:hypothetical protein